MLHLILDGRSVDVPPGYTLLQAARENGIPIPTLCYHEALLPYGACRLCLVELVGPRGSRLVASCAYPCEPDLNVRTNSELVLRTRKAVLELLLATGAPSPVIRTLAAEAGITVPYLAIEPTSGECILCGLCVRACRELVGVGAISLTRRGMEKQVSTPFEISSAECIECGTCALVCPTGAIRVEHVSRPIRTAHAWQSQYERRACRLCEHEPAGSPFPSDYRELIGPDRHLE
jgi:NADH dehydrogenase/NADH:ubiquinone oxidoreductase subunit G